MMEDLDLGDGDDHGGPLPVLPNAANGKVSSDGSKVVKRKKAKGGPPVDAPPPTREWFACVCECVCVCVQALTRCAPRSQR